MMKLFAFAKGKKVPGNSAFFEAGGVEDSVRDCKKDTATRVHKHPCCGLVVNLLSRRKLCDFAALDTESGHQTLLVEEKGVDPFLGCAGGK